MSELSNIRLNTVDLSRDDAARQAIIALLASHQLELEHGITQFVVAYAGELLIGCAGLTGNIIKCVAVDAQWRGANLGAKLLSELQSIAAQQGHFHLFLYTRPSNRELFEQSGFWAITQTHQVLLMENTPRGISRYCQQLATQCQVGHKVGAIVLNADPFTLGHRYLIEQAAQQCDWLHLFVVQEEAATFSFADRLAMVRAGVANFSNVSVHAGGAYIISKATFPGYFLKSSGQIEQAWCELDLKIFREYIAPALQITHRFVGSEPFCSVTRQYNAAMSLWLGSAPSGAAPLHIIEIPRFTMADGVAISASAVRSLIQQQQFSDIQERVPATTYRYLQGIIQ